MHDVVEGGGAGLVPDTAPALRQLLNSPQGLLELVPVAVYVCDADGVIVQYNKRAAELWGRSPKPGELDERFCGSFKLFLSDGQALPHAETPMAEVLKTGRPARDVDVVIERPDGSRIAVLVNIDPLFDESGKLSGAVNCFQDITERKRTREALQRSEAELNDFFENGAIPMHWAGPDGTILRANRSELEMLGYSEEEYVGRNVAEFHVDQEVIADILERLSAGETLHNRRARLRCKDGSVRDVVISSSVRWEDGRFTHTRCFTRDVTERRRAEKKLEEQERRFRELLQSLPGAIYTTDAGGRITFYNEAAAELWGCRPELGDAEWCGSWRLYWPDGSPLPHDDCPMAVALKENRAVRGVEAIAERPDGTRVPFLPFPTPLRDERGNLVGAVNMLVDITEQKRANEALRAIEALNSKILESSRDCVKVLDLDARLLSINERGQAYLEVDDIATIANVSYVNFWSGEERTAAAEAVEQARRGNAGRFVGFYRTPSGKETWWDELVTPILDAAGHPERLLVISRDISERKQAEEQRELLLAELDHRVKNMLATVQAIARVTFGDSRHAQLFAGRIDAFAKAHHILSQGKWEGAQLFPLLRTILEAFGERVEIAGHDAWLSAKGIQAMSMIIHELATNASKHGALSVPDGNVMLQSRADGPAKTLLLEWTEHGGPAVEAPQRTGFGSRLVERSLKHEFGGSMDMEFRSEGLRCTITLPLSNAVRLVSSGAPERPAKARQLGERAALHGKQILLVEDSALIAMELQELLVTAGCDVLGPVGRLRSAMELAERETVDGAVLDINLGGELVFPLAERLRANGVPFIFVTGYDLHGVVPDEFRTVRRVGKPIDSTVLLSALAEVLAVKNTTAAA